jgi:uncharacterized cupredoxin-like copper-binding protein
MRVNGCALVVLPALFSTPVAVSAQQTVTPASNGETLTVRLSNFAFEPDHLHLKAGVPVRLRLVNDSGGGHDFGAPAFFAASSFPAGSSAPPNGEVPVGSHQTVELTLVPRTPGAYRLECSHFLHSIFGMHGAIEVIP